MSAQAHPSLGSGRYGQCVMEFAKVKPYTKSNDMLAKGEENDFDVRPLEKYSTQYFRGFRSRGAGVPDVCEVNWPKGI